MFNYKDTKYSTVGQLKRLLNAHLPKAEAKVSKYIQLYFIT